MQPGLMKKNVPLGTFLQDAKYVPSSCMFCDIFDKKCPLGAAVFIFLRTDECTYHTFYVILVL